MTNPFTVKWAAPNTLYIRSNKENDDNRLYMSKVELISLRDEINEFIEYYSTDFSKANINTIDLPEDYDI